MKTVAERQARGVESQLLSHVRISLNVGLTPDQLRGFSRTLEARDQAQAAGRLTRALDALATDQKA